MIKDKLLPELIVELANSHDGSINQLERLIEASYKNDKKLINKLNRETRIKV